MCNYNSEATIDDATCTNYFDCTGECGGLAVIDECGECNGDGIDEGACDCHGNVEDCWGDCDGPAVVDDCGNCGGNCIDDGNGFVSCGNNDNNLINADECGICAGPNKNCVLDVSNHISVSNIIFFAYTFSRYHHEQDLDDNFKQVVFS